MVKLVELVLYLVAGLEQAHRYPSEDVHRGLIHIDHGEEVEDYFH